MFNIEPCDNDNKDDDANDTMEANKKTINTTPIQPFAQSSQQRTKIVTPVNDTRPQSSLSNKKKKLLDLYGKRIDGGKWYNKVMFSLLIIAVVGTACVAFYQGCLLAAIYVYADGPCPSYGVMDCYYGSTQIYFNCSVGAQINGTLFNESAICFRFIAKDISVNEAVTQLGACAGLFNALCAITQLVLRFLIYAWRKRKLTPEEIEKRNPMITAVSDEEKAVKNSNWEFKHPIYALLSLLLFIILIAAPLAGIGLFTGFKISTSALTYVLLFVVAAIGIIAIVWIVKAEVNDDDNEQIDDQHSENSMTVENVNETAASTDEKCK